MTNEKPPPRPCECGCGVLLAQRARGSSKRVVDWRCERRLAAAREADAVEARAVAAFKVRVRRADAKSRLLSL